MYNGNLQNLDGFESLEYVGNDLIMRGNLSSTFSGLQSLDFDGRLLSVKAFESGEPEFDFPELSTVGQKIALGAINGIDTLNFFGQLNSLGEIHTGTLTLTLAQFQDLIYIEHIGHEDLNSLDSWESGKGGLWILSMPNLVSLSGLDQFKKINGRFDVYNCPSLTDISMLYSLDSLGGNLIIEDNISLSDCSPICTFLEENYFGGELILENNSFSCNSWVEIDSVFCNPSYTLNVEKSDFKVFPNPANAFLNIQNGFDQNGVFTLTDLDGRTVMSQEIDQPSFSIDTQNFAQGIYFFTFKTEDMVLEKGKIIIIH